MVTNQSIKKQKEGEREMKKGKIDLATVALAIFVLSFGGVIFMAWEFVGHDLCMGIKTCKGYDYSLTATTEPGYAKCCNNVYDGILPDNQTLLLSAFFALIMTVIVQWSGT